jgi:GH25 family lysozyme M1 (1,4-beta-N-acetylmuramidase)
VARLVLCSASMRGTFSACSAVLVAACVAPPSDHVDVQTTPPDIKVTQVCGVGPTVMGVDVSTYEGTIDWTEAAAAGVVYTFVRVSDGLDFPDDTFATNWAGSRSAGVIHGAYQFFEPDQDPVQQADMLLSAMGTFEADDLPPVIDVEVTDSMDPADVHTAVQAWIDHVAAAIGRPPIIYVGAYFWDDDVGGYDDTSSPLWHAQYTTAACPTIADPWTTWAFWQYTDTGTVDGIPGASANTDINRWNGDMASLTAFLGPVGSCGDGTCSAGETPISCPEDCGPCGTVDATNGFIIDDGDACFQDGGPAAYLRDVTTAGYQDDLVWTHTTADATESNYATWNFYFASAGHYKIEAYTDTSYAQSKQAKYVVTGAGGAQSSAVLDQTAADGWQTIGEFDFAAGGHQSIHLGDNTGEPSADNVQLVFDGIRITPASGSGNTGSGSSGPITSADGSTGGDGYGGNGGSGCNAGGASQGALVMLTLAGLARRRRR